MHSIESELGPDSWHDDEIPVPGTLPNNPVGAANRVSVESATVDQRDNGADIPQSIKARQKVCFLPYCVTLAGSTEAYGCEQMSVPYHLQIWLPHCSDWYLWQRGS